MRPVGSERTLLTLPTSFSPQHDPRVGERLGAVPGKAAEVAIGVAAKMEPRDRFLAGVAALLIRNTAVLVEADFLHQGLFVNLGAAARPSGENTCGFPLVVGGGAGTFEGEFLEGVGDLIQSGRQGGT